MVVEPRFLFVARMRSRSDSWSPWPGTRALATEETRSYAPWVAWRLLGANNRELGRSGSTFADLTGCIASIGALKQALEDSTSLVAPDPSTGSWYWRLDFGGEPLAVAGRAYRRQRECVYSLEQFRAAAPDAQLAMRSVVDLTNSEDIGELATRIPPRQPARLPGQRSPVDGFVPPVVEPGPFLTQLGGS